MNCIVLPLDCTTLPMKYVAQFDALISDPPFSPYVHVNAVSAAASGGKNLRGVEKRDFGFQPLGTPTREWLMRAAGAVKRWSCIFSDIESTHLLRELAVTKDASKRERGARAVYVRTIPWIRWSQAQLAGTTPPSGREDVVLFHADDDPVLDLTLFYGALAGGKSWAGPGNLTHFDACCMRGSGKHKAQKPLDLMLDLVSWFSSPGETVFDPFAGSGTTGLACSLLGRRFVGCELLPQWVTSANARLTSELDARDLERCARWLAPRKQGAGAPGDTETGPTGIRRAEARARDRAIFLADPRIAKLAA